MSFIPIKLLMKIICVMWLWKRWLVMEVARNSDFFFSGSCARCPATSMSSCHVMSYHDYLKPRDFVEPTAWIKESSCVSIGRTAQVRGTIPVWQFNFPLRQKQSVLFAIKWRLFFSEESESREVVTGMSGICGAWAQILALTIPTERRSDARVKRQR